MFTASGIMCLSPLLITLTYHQLTDVTDVTLGASGH